MHSLAQSLWSRHEVNTLLQHGLSVTYINRIAMQQGLLVKFSCKSPLLDSLLRALLKSAYYKCHSGECVKIVDSGLYFIFSFHFILFFFSFFFLIFYFQNNSGQGLSVTLSHQSQVDGIVTRLITGLGRMKQKVLEQSDVIQHGQHMLASCYTHGHLGQGAQQLVRTMSNSI